MIEAEKSLREEEGKAKGKETEEQMKKSKGVFGTLRDWVKGLFNFY